MICDLRAGGRLTADGEVDPAGRRVPPAAATVRAAHAPHEDRRHHRPRLARPRGARPDGRGGHGRRAAELLPRQRRASTRRPRSACATPPTAPAAPSRSCRTCPGRSCASASSRDGHRRAQARRRGHVRLRRARRPRATRAACTSRGPGSPTRSSPTRSSTSPTARCACGSRAHAAGDGEIDAVVEIGGSVASRQGLNIPGETAALPSVPEEDFHHLETGEKIGVDLVALSFVRRAEDIEVVRKHTRLPLIAKIEKPQAVERAEEIVARRRLRDGRARRPRHRAADRGGADRPEADHLAGRRARPPGRSPRRRCSTRWSPPRARRAPR